MKKVLSLVLVLCLMAGVIALHKAGLKDWTWEEAK